MNAFIQCILARMVIVLKLVVALAVAGILRCTHVKGQVPTCKFSIKDSYTISVRPIITVTVILSGLSV